MKLSIALITFCLISAFSLPASAQGQPFIEEGGNSKVVKNADGSQSHYHKNAGQQGMTRTTYDATGRLTCVIVYRTGAHGQLTSCKVYDGNKNELYKVAYGYETKGVTVPRLREEHMFDSNKLDPKTGKNLLVRRFIYTYDDQGNRSRPIAIVLTKGYEGKAVEATMPEVDPYADEKKQTPAR